MASTLIGITGQQCSGNDTAGAHFVENLGYTRLALADPIETIVAAIGPFVGERPAATRVARRSRGS